MRDFTLVSPFAALSLAVGAPPHAEWSRGRMGRRW